MINSFRRRVRKAIANLELQAALDRNADQRMKAWETAFDSLPEVDHLRHHAHEIRQHTIANLDHYLKRFTQQLVDNGIRVHKASNSEEACLLVVSIAKSHDARLVTK